MTHFERLLFPITTLALLASVAAFPKAGWGQVSDEEGLLQALDDKDETNRDWVAARILADPEWDDLRWEERASATAELFGVDEDMLEHVVTTEFIEGFLEGAAEVWDELADKI